MAKRANAGSLRTAVNFVRVDREQDDDGFPVETEVNIFGGPIYAQWVNAHGSEVYQAAQLQLREPATITVRYSPLINKKLRAYRVGDAAPYEIISVDNVEQRGVWMEIKIQRMEVAR